LYGDVYQSLGELDLKLCDWVYGAGISASVPHLASVSSLGQFPEIVLDVKAAKAEADEDGDGYYDEEASSTAWVTYLSSFLATSAKLLAAHWDAVDVANAIENGSLTIDDIQELDEQDLRVYLMHQFRFFVPDGIAQRLAANAQMDADMIKEEHDIRKARLGHTFTFDRHGFWQILGEVSQDVRKGFVQLGLRCPIVSSGITLSSHEFEYLYFNDPRGAFQRQDYYNDEGAEDTDLLILLRLLEQAVRDEPSRS
jgi:hypothetical protein